MSLNEKVVKEKGQPRGKSVVGVCCHTGYTVRRIRERVDAVTDDVDAV